MKTLPFFICGLLCYEFLFSQKIVDVTKQPTRVGAQEAVPFNTKVTWQNEQDTSNPTIQEQYVAKQEYVLQQIIPATGLFAESGNDPFRPRDKSRMVFPIQLPENTVEWYYQVSVSADVPEQTKESFNLAGELTGLIEQSGGVQFNLELLTQPPTGAAYCEVYVMDQENAICFEAKDDYKYSLIGSSGHIRSGIIKVLGGGATPLFLGINNPDAENGMNVTLECVAIVLKEERGVRDVQKRNVAGKMVPVMNSDNISWIH